MTAWDECGRTKENSREDRKEGSQAKKQELLHRSKAKNSPDTLGPSRTTEVWGRETLSTLSYKLNFVSLKISHSCKRFPRNSENMLFWS